MSSFSVRAAANLVLQKKVGMNFYVKLMIRFQIEWVTSQLLDPGATQLTRILSEAVSELRALVRPISAVLLTE